VTIDVYADIACPWCYVGRARLKQALDRRADLDVTLRWRPFQLQPDMPPAGRDFREVLAQKFGGWDRARRMFDRIRELGSEMDLTFDFDAIEVAPNTADAHRLVLWAEDRDGASAADAMATALFRAYFSEGRNVSDADVPADCAAAAGLDRDAARTLLDGTDDVRESQQRAQRRGITGVPCYVVDDAHAVTGAQPTDVFVEALDAAAAPSPQQE
jgi:predicted DsbA family dithiol-disulfide isomerase